MAPRARPARAPRCTTRIIRDAARPAQPSNAAAREERPLTGPMRRGLLTLPSGLDMRKILATRKAGAVMRYLACTLAIILLAGAALRPDAGMPAIGVVDVNQVFEKSAKWRDMEKVLEARRTACQEEIDALVQQVEKLRETLEQSAAGSPEFIRLQAELIKKEAYLGSTSQQYDLELGRADAANYDGFTAELDAAIADLARETGLALVIQRTLETSEGEWRSVLYAHQGADLTASIIERLNAKHSREKK